MRKNTRHARTCKEIHKIGACGAPIADDRLAKCRDFTSTLANFEAEDDLAEVTHYYELDAFWDHLSPIGKHFGQEAAKFVFRGQGDSAWRLTPGAFRKEVMKPYMSALNESSPTNQVFLEWLLLYSFVRHCDSTGLPIPGDSMRFRRRFDWDSIGTIYGKSSKGWPCDELIPLIALAQHHGIPTRLLDWTSNPYIACYFAALTAVKEGAKKGKRLAVFAFDTGRPGLIDNLGLKQLNVPGSTSVNLCAQSGSFLLIDYTGGRNDNDPFDWGKSMESRIPRGSGLLHKITLPQSLAGDLMLRCAKFGFSAASLFPGYDGAANAVLEDSRALDATRR